MSVFLLQPPKGKQSEVEVSCGARQVLVTDIYTRGHNTTGPTTQQQHHRTLN